MSILLDIRLRRSLQCSILRAFLSSEPILDLLTTIRLAGVTGAVASAVMNWLFEGRKFKREQRLADLKEKVDRYYSPLNFHFENMRSWAVFLRSSDRYAWASETLANKLEDMKEIMRSGLRFASPQVQALWYEWQPFAVAAVEESRKGKAVYQQFDRKGLLDRTERLHDAIKAEKDDLLKRYHKEIDSGGAEI